MGVLIFNLSSNTLVRLAQSSSFIENAKLLHVPAQIKSFEVQPIVMLDTEFKVDSTEMWAKNQCAVYMEKFDRNQSVAIIHDGIVQPFYFTYPV